MNRLGSLACGLGLASVVWGLAGSARACGGFVCDQATAVVPPVQNGERIVFAVRDGPQGRRTTATVQISYTGEVDSFAWVVPLASVPDSIEVASPALFEALDRATQPTFVQAGGQAVYDDGYDASSSSGGCGADSGPSSRGTASGPPTSGRSASEVTVFGRERVGPYETVVVGTDDAAALGLWLQQNGYDLTQEADALIGSYVGARSTFLAVKLVPGAATSALEPLQFTYEGDPCLPLRLTAISSADLLPVQVFVAAEARAVPLDWASLAPDYDSELLVADGTTNYRELVDHLTGELAGHGWVTEYAGPSAGPLLAAGAAAGALADLPYLTRLLARVPRAALDRDPHFTVDPAAPPVDNVHLLPARPISRASAFAAPAWWPVAALLLALAALRRRAGR